MLLLLLIHLISTINEKYTHLISSSALSFIILFILALLLVLLHTWKQKHSNKKTRAALHSAQTPLIVRTIEAKLAFCFAFAAAVADVIATAAADVLLYYPRILSAWYRPLIFSPNSYSFGIFLRSADSLHLMSLSLESSLLSTAFIPHRHARVHKFTNKPFYYIDIYKEKIYIALFKRSWSGTNICFITAMFIIRLPS